MTPNREKAAAKAVDTVIEHNLNPDFPDPLCVLKRLNNVALIPFEADPGFLPGDNQSSFTLVNRDHEKLQYIILYNKGLQAHKLRLSLSRELAHVILEHDGTSPEAIWDDEAMCFAYHFLCPLPLLRFFEYGVQIKYRPKRNTPSWEFKEMIIFNCVEDMKTYVVEERNKINRYIGKPAVQYRNSDVSLLERCDYDPISGWKNCYDISLGGKIIGHCGK